METNTTIFSIITLKWLFPSLIGSSLAVWYKRKDVDWGCSTTCDKIKVTLIGIGAIIIGVYIAHITGGAILEKFEITSYFYSSIVYGMCGLSSLKTLDAIVKNMDPILDMVTTGVKDAISGVIKSIVDKYKK